MDRPLQRQTRHQASAGQHWPPEPAINPGPQPGSLCSGRQAPAARQRADTGDQRRMVSFREPLAGHRRGTARYHWRIAAGVAAAGCDFLQRALTPTWRWTIEAVKTSWEHLRRRARGGHWASYAEVLYRLPIDSPLTPPSRTKGWNCRAGRSRAAVSADGPAAWAGGPDP